MGIHPSAVIAAGAEIAPDVEIGPFCVVGAQVKIGAGCRLISHVSLDGLTTLGPGNTLYPFASVGQPPQDLKYKGELTTLVIGAKNIIREYVTIQPGTAHGTHTTTVGDSNLFMACAHVAHDCRVGNGNIFANGAMLAGHVEVENGVILGGGVGLHQFVRVGDRAFIGAGSMVAKDVPPFAMAQGDRAHIRGVNLVGLRRSGVPVAEISAIKEVFRELFFRGGKWRERRAGLSDALLQSPAVKQILTFVDTSKRGLLSARRGAEEEDLES